MYVFIHAHALKALARRVYLFVCLFVAVAVWLGFSFCLFVFLVLFLCAVIVYCLASLAFPAFASHKPSNI